MELVDESIVEQIQNLVAFSGYENKNFNVTRLNITAFLDQKVTAPTNEKFSKPIKSVLFKKPPVPEYICRKQSLAQFIRYMPRAKTEVTQRILDQIIITYCATGELPPVFNDYHSLKIYKLMNVLQATLLVACLQLAHEYHRN